MKKKACPDCPGTNAERGSLMGWDEWASEMDKTHRQSRCPTCKLWTVWILKTSDPTGDDSRLVARTDNVRSSRAAKLNINKARIIRRSNDTNAELAREFGVTAGTIAHVRRGTTWREHDA